MQESWNDKLKDVWDDYRGWILLFGAYTVYSIATKDRTPKNIPDNSQNNQ